MTSGASVTTATAILYSEFRTPIQISTANRRGSVIAATRPYCSDLESIRDVRVPMPDDPRTNPTSIAAVEAVRKAQLEQQHQPKRETVTHIPMRMY